MISKTSARSGRWMASVCGVVALLVPATIAQAKPFRSAKGYSVTPPAGWRVIKNGVIGADVAFVAPPLRDFAANLNVVVTQAAGETLRSARSKTNATLPRIFNGYKRIAQSYTTLGGLRALSTTAIYSMDAPTRRIRMKQVAVLRGNRACFFTATALDANFSTYNAIFNKTLQTVRFR